MHSVVIRVSAGTTKRVDLVLVPGEALDVVGFRFRLGLEV